MTRIHLITGGVRSGKSEYAEQMVLTNAAQNGARPLYIATAQIYDEAMRQRVELHRKRRADRWDLAEELTDPGKLNISGRIVLIDCMTLWLTNIFFQNNEDVTSSLSNFEENFRHLLYCNADTIYIVTNEIGLGGVAANPMQRKFADLQGWANQIVARVADSVTMMVCGLPMKIK